MNLLEFPEDFGKMKCPKCGDPDYYEGIVKRDCPNPDCEMPGTKRVAQKEIQGTLWDPDEEDSWSQQWPTPGDPECLLVVTDPVGDQVMIEYERASFKGHVVFDSKGGEHVRLEIRTTQRLVNTAVKNKAGK